MLDDVIKKLTEIKSKHGNLEMYLAHRKIEEIHLTKNPFEEKFYVVIN